MSETFQEMLERYKRELLGVQKHKVLPPGESEAPISPNPTHDGEEKTEYPCKQEKETDFSQTAGENGPILLQDGILHETLENFVHTKIPERAVHVKGYGAFGTFQLYQSLREYTSACFLQESGSKTPVFVRFSQAAGKKGSPDTARDIRGFALKFYTQQGNYDIVGNHIPVFFVRDSMRFPETIAALSPSPHSNLPDPRRLWEFVAHTPQTIHMLTWLYSDWGTLASYRHMRGYGVNTFVWKNARGKRRLIKYHWRPCAGVQYLTRQEAIRLAGTDPDIAGKDLHRALESGKRVEYEMYVQIMDPSQSPTLTFNPLDDTKVWDETQFPLLPIGKLTLEKNPENYQTQVEEAAFSPANLIDGIELSTDRILQGRSFLYWDAQRHRLGNRFRDIPVNHFPGWSIDQSILSSADGEQIEGAVERVPIHREDDFTQAGERYLSLCKTQREHLVDNIACELYAMPKEILDCVIGYFAKANEEFGGKIRKRCQFYQAQDEKKSM